MNAVSHERPLILNVDDDLAGRYVKTRSLKLGGLDVAEAETGTSALEQVARLRPALVLLDVNLPDMNGLDVCRCIKRDWPDTIVVQISAISISAADRVVSLDGGADCYLTTPIEPTELIAVTRAMLRLRQAEITAQEAGERYRMIVESAVDYAIFTCGLDGRITGWNSGAEAILGYVPEQIIGEPCARIFLTGDVAKDVPGEEMRAAHQGASVRAERWHVRRDGTCFWSSGRMVALRDRSGQVVGYLKILYDRTTEKSARDALQALNDQLESRVAERTRALEEANHRLRQVIEERERSENQVRQLQKIEALGQLTGGIAHDFNNLLTAILGGIEVSRRRIKDERTLRLLDSATQAAERGARLVAQLLAFARKQTLEVESVNLYSLLQEMRELLGRSLGGSINVEFLLEKDLWPVLADATQLQVALLNLAINARDAMPGGGTLTIQARNRTVTAADGSATLVPGDYGEISVKDVGLGMTEEVRVQVFEPFFTTKPMGKGTGLGLSMVYGFVRQSSGDIGIESAPGKGTTIWMLLPRAG
jgi:PAS domain S-box-containing protein